MILMTISSVEFWWSVLCVRMCCYSMFILFFFFKQKTAYEMRISDWSSDVCSSDLLDILEKRITNKYRRRFEPYASTPGKQHSTPMWLIEIGRASCRERVCQYV